MNETAPDVVCIQELKAQEDQLTDELFHPESYKAYFHCAEKKGYSGTAIYTRQTPSDLSYGLGWDDFDSEGRCVRADFEDLTVISLYMPSGTSSDERQQFKEIVLERFRPLLEQLQNDGRNYVICGDINIAHKPVDLRNWKSNRSNSGFLPQERSWMDWLFGSAGYIDAFRKVNTRPGQYTWWSNRGDSYNKNVGWRLDYQILSNGLRQTVDSVHVYKDVKFSDHAPVIAEYDLSRTQ